MEQEVRLIDIKDLVLWTENPRDPIDENAVDQDIVDRALEDVLNKWSLGKLAKEMGDYYDFSELPTVVYHNKKPVVYDGNRRIVLGKIKHGIVKVNGVENILLPEFPEKIPCNVCSKTIALKNVLRKHSDIGSWQPLERDRFLHKFMGKEKSLFLAIDEETGIISANPHLNQRFVKEEIFKEETLKAMGFILKNGSLYSVHDTKEGHSILADITKKIKNKDISTRKYRGKVIEVLEPSSQKIIDQNKNNKPKPFGVNFNKSKRVVSGSATTKRQSPRTPPKKTEIFGGLLYLRMGEVGNLYRDIVDLYGFYIKERSRLSQAFPSLIRMSLRLLCEKAAKDSNDMKLDNYLKKYFTEAKDRLDQDGKTTLSTQNITETSIVQLLHIGAHNYASAKNLEQTMALSIIVGEILTVTHGKDN
ncbi:MAG: hypothetical protein K9K37_11585 [Desulfocapsa sp.]|nr:hypothetical protein [Desulfocapsa sp.]